MLVTIPIKSTEATVLRFVANAAIKDIRHIYGISEDTQLIFLERRGEVKNPDMAEDTNVAPVDIESSDKLIISYRTAINEHATELTKMQREHPPIFLAKELGIVVYPNYRKEVMALDITYHSKSYDTLRIWLDRFQDTQAVRNSHNYHDIAYTYQLPDILIAYIHDVYVMTEAVSGYGRTMAEFLQAYFTKGILTRMNMAGSRTALAANVRLNGVLGMFDSIPQEIETDTEKAVNSIQFSYTIEFDRVSGVVLDFQTFIHNQRMDPVYHGAFFPPQRQKLPQARGIPTVNARIGDTPSTPFAYADSYIPYDDVFFDPQDLWHPSTIRLHTTSTLLMVPIQLDPYDLRSVLQTSDIASLYSDERSAFWRALSDIMILFRDSVVKDFTFPLQVELYSVGMTENARDITIDVNGNIRATRDLNIRDRHYLRVSIVSDWGLLVDALWRLVRNPAVAQFLINILDPSIILPTIGNGTSLNMEALLKAIRYLQDTNFQFKSTYGTHRVFYVAVNEIIARLRG